jgi:peptide/nickel transport system substrate-binding protein
MVLEPPGMDPTIAPAAAIGEIVHYNVLEGLTKVNVDGSVTPLLAESWTMDPDGKSYTFKLRRGVKFHDGEAFDASDVKFSFERAKDDKSTNKAKKAVFDNIRRVDTPDAHTVILTLENADPNFLFRMGENTAVILDPKSAAGAATRPVGTGPFTFDDWKKGNSVTLKKWPGFRDSKSVRLERANFRFINDPAARVAALLAGDIDGVPRLDAPQAVKQLQGDKRFTVSIGSTAGKGIVAINNRKKPFDDVRVRRAIMHAIDRKAFIDGVLEGLGQPIGSHFAPTDAGYVDLTAMTPHDPDKARALLREAGVTTPLNVTLTPAAAAVRAQGRRGRRGAAGQGGHRGQDRERRVGAVAGRAVQGQLRPDHHQPRRAAGLHAVRQHRLLLGLRQQGLPRPDGEIRRHIERQGPIPAVRRHPEAGRRRPGQRLRLQPGPGGGGEEGAQGPVVELADLRQRPRRGVVAIAGARP